MSKSLGQFKLLIIKNYKTAIRSGADIFWEFALPLVIALLLLWIRGVSNSSVVEEPTIWKEHDLLTWPAGLEPPYLNDENKSEFIILYAPDNNFTKSMADKLNYKLMLGVNLYSSQEHFIASLLSKLEMITPDHINMMIEMADNDMKVNQTLIEDFQKDKAKFIEEKVKPEVLGILWNPCKREDIFKTVFNIHTPTF